MLLIGDMFSHTKVNAWRILLLFLLINFVTQLATPWNYVHISAVVASNWLISINMAASK